MAFWKVAALKDPVVVQKGWGSEHKDSSYMSTTFVVTEQGKQSITSELTAFLPPAAGFKSLQERRTWKDMVCISEKQHSYRARPAS